MTLAEQILEIRKYGIGPEQGGFGKYGKSLQIITSNYKGDVSKELIMILQRKGFWYSRGIFCRDTSCNTGVIIKNSSCNITAISTAS